MNAKKVIFAIAIGFNIILILLTVSIYSKMNDGRDIATNEIQHQLIDLETVIGDQMKSSWIHPEYVGMKLNESLKTMNRSLEVIDELSIVRMKDYTITSSLLRKLEQYKKSEFYEYAKFNPQDIANYEKLQAILREEGFGMGITSTMNDYDAFLKKMNVLNEKIPNPLESNN